MGQVQESKEKWKSTGDLVLHYISTSKSYRSVTSTKCYLSLEADNKYSDSEKLKILHTLNSSDSESLSRYDVAKTRVKKLSEWIKKYGKLKDISELENVDGFTEKTVKKFYKSILDGPKNVANRIKGQILHPTLLETVRQNCRSVLSVYVTVNSVCWTLIDRTNYELLEWKYHGIEYPDGKRLQINEILDIAWQITTKLPEADIYVMKAESTSLRAAGSDPNNPKVLTVNLQKAQMIAMMIALINTRNINVDRTSGENTDKLNQKIYFLRSTLPYRLYGTLVGNERVSTDQTVEMLLENAKKICPNNSHVYVSESIVSMFRSQKELQKDMMGHSLLLGLTFMDICIYMNQKSIAKLSRNGET
ncbi:PREDICTED: transcription elongation factor, mitochondrial isoform X2 [Papilio xuthus]|uniref:Transcription elongation factor, mitochondrial isoform X2 n=1 Tax=Papilio xuthus TaxID=66420 RepID=A0AAJ7ECX9_PAPXU|nr:PREDICTED: transcription elongation factor, mitochondrial isoform X2 [Papilio xuthus]